MLSESQRKQFGERAKTEAQKILFELGILELTEDNICDLQKTLDVRVASLVSAKECDNLDIDEELLKIYDLLTDIVLDNEEDVDFLNSLFFNKVEN